MRTDTPQRESAGCANAFGQNFSVEIGGINVALSSSGPAICAAGAISRFLVDEGCDTCAVRLNVRWSDKEPVARGKLLFDSEGVWQLYEEDGFNTLIFAAPFSGWRPYKIARFVSDWSSGEILCEREYYDSGEPIYPLEYPLDELLFINLLARGRGVEVHACAIVDEDGKGYLFPGQSGDGKSTTARIWSGREGVKILSDERVILREEGGRIFMYGTPWHGDARISRAEKAPLSRIFFLGRGLTNELLSLSQAESAARIVARSFPPFHSAEGLAFTLEFLDRVTRQVECSELRFVPDERVIDFVRG